MKLLSPDLMELLDPDALKRKKDEQVHRTQKEETIRSAVALRRSAGRTVPELALEFEMTEEEILTMVSDPAFTRKVLSLQIDQGVAPHQRIQMMVAHALEVKYHLMLHSEQDSVRDRAASDILDRAWGKSVQRVESKNYNLTATTDLNKLNESIEDVERQLKELESTKQALRAG